jgi:hypothetical protein
MREDKSKEYGQKRMWYSGKGKFTTEKKRKEVLLMMLN